MKLSLGLPVRRLPFLASTCLASLLCLAALGCKKDAFINTVNQTPYLGLPQNQKDLGSVDVRRLRDREFFKQYVDGLKQSGQYEIWDTLVQNLGSDPFQDIDTVVMANRATPNPGEFPLKNAVFIAIGKFDNPAQKIDGLYKWLQSEVLITPPPFTEAVHSPGKFKKYSLEAKSQYNEATVISINIGFPSDRMMVVSFSPPLLGETLDVIAGKADGIAKDPALLEMVRRPNLGAIIWGAGLVDQATSNFIQTFLKGVQLGGVQQYYFAFNSQSGFKSDCGLVCSSIDTAAQLKNELKARIVGVQMQMATSKMFLPETVKAPDKFLVLPEDNTVKISLSLSEQESAGINQEWRQLQEKNKKGAVPMLLPAVVSTPTPIPTPTPKPTPVPTAPVATPWPGQGKKAGKFSGFYKVLVRHTGKALTVKSASMAENGAVVQYNYGGATTNDEWEFTDIGGGFYKIINRNSKKALAVKLPGEGNGASVVQITYSPTPPANDEWIPVDIGGGYYMLVNRNSNKVLNVPSGRTTNNAGLDQLTWNGAPYQQFQILPVQ